MTDLFSDVDSSERGQAAGLWGRRVVMALFALISLAALIGFTGQRASTSAASAPAVRMKLSAPEVVRGGLFFQSRVDIRALAPIAHPRIVLADGWIEGLQVNSIEPAAETETSRDGHVVLSYGELKTGDVLRVWLQFEVDPTSVGKRDYTLELDDAERPLARIPRTIRVLP
jgi:hypothetical protein